MDLSGSWSYIQSTAKSRLAHNITPRHVYEYGEGIELLGVAGEIIARRFLGLDEQIHEGFDHGVDILFYGMKIDVKATLLTPKIAHRFLQWPVWKRVKSDIVLLTAVDPLTRQGTVLGYATRAEIVCSPVNQERDWPCHEIALDKLHPAWELVVEKVKPKGY